MVEWLFLAVPWGCLLFVIVVFPDHTHYFCRIKAHLILIGVAVRIHRFAFKSKVTICMLFSTLHHTMFSQTLHYLFFLNAVKFLKKDKKLKSVFCLIFCQTDVIVLF